MNLPNPGNVTPPNDPTKGIIFGRYGADNPPPATESNNNLLETNDSLPQSSGRVSGLAEHIHNETDNLEDRRKLLGEVLAKYQALPPEEQTGLDLSGLKIPGIILPPETFKFPPGTILTDADLSNATLNGVQLAGVKLANANLSGASLIEANLRGAQLKGANLENTNLRNADLTGAVLHEAGWGANGMADEQPLYLVQTDFTGANLTGVNFPDDTNAREAKFTDANLVGAVINGNFSDADFSGADVTRAEIYATIDGASFAKATLLDATVDNEGAMNVNDPNAVDFSGAYMDGANLSGPLTGSTFDGASMQNSELRAGVNGSTFDGTDMKNAIAPEYIYFEGGKWQGMTEEQRNQTSTRPFNPQQTEGENQGAEWWE